MTDLMQARLMPTNGDKSIGVITINRPKALNAQNLEMVKFTAQTLDDWANDDNVAMVVLHGAGDKSLCAGGDIKSLYTNADEAEEFFGCEYGLMYNMHTYCKPVLSWGNGIVMGGGLGLHAASSHKVVTQSTLMAMPEVSIGLFPDAGASYFLNRMMEKVGLFLGLTGARFNGDDALYLGLADFAIEHEQFEAVLDGLTKVSFADDDLNHHRLTAFLQQFHRTDILAQGEILPNFAKINALMNAGDLLLVDKALQEYAGDSSFIQTAIDSYQNGSALTKAITWHIYHHLKTHDLSLDDIFKIEKAVAIQCVQQGDFKEGVRALLVDKDKNPKWQFSLSQINEACIRQYVPF
ncbi:enoyl-CoA hydratase/isomerase family protein [Moraxella nasovis]|uniref:enoyl-CoA hydratase/isomerase family protein n=1 Tax=Moraxella nasovis TaxID=2904121 RepID=UPI001F623172|nr:enoyl-CoA hydratase/isomerase family protein [Moraxella nasovis]UNU72830.1 enoyl-CoA hydratase/isomerase family protein [Moraxella nasovis]